MKISWPNKYSVAILLFLSINFCKSEAQNLPTENNNTPKKQVTKQNIKSTQAKKKLIKKQEQSYFTNLKNQFEFNSRLEWINQLSQVVPAFSDLDLDNSRYQQKTSSLTSQLNIELKFSFFNSTYFIDRSHIFISSFDQAIGQSTNQQHQYDKEFKINHSEALIRQIVSDQLNAEIGLLNFQWGPAEFATPSNPLFTFSPNKNILTNIDHGRYLGKINWTPLANLNFIYLNEFKNNPLIETIADNETFKKTQLFKTEFNSELNSNNYFGLSFYQKESQKMKSGFYGQWQITDELSIYTDLLYLPKDSNQTNSNSNSTTLTEKNSSFGILGLRHSGDWDKRIELIQNSIGLDKNELEQLISTIITAQNLLHLDFSNTFKDGFPIYGKEYLYLSLRIPDFFNNQDLQFFLRDVISMQDQSSQIQTSFEYNIGDATLVNVQWQTQLGNKNSEFNVMKSQTYVIAFKTVW